MSVDVDPSASIDTVRALAEPLRWEIVGRLAEEELCVCHLVDELGVAQPLVSHHLKVLRAAGIVESERFRQWTYYRLVPAAIAGIGRDLTGMAKQARAARRNRRPCC